MKIFCGTLILAAWWCVAAAGICNVTLGNNTYREEILLIKDWWIRGLAVDHNRQVMYFSFDNGSWYNGKLDIRSKAFSVIEELSGPCWYTADPERDEVHAGCRTDGGAPGGLYQLDSSTNQFKLIGEAGRNVRFVYNYKGILYYAFWPKLLLHTFTNGNSSLLTTPAAAVEGYIVNTPGHHIFQNDTGVYWRHGDSAGETQYEEFSEFVNELAVDGHGAAYACDIATPRGIWLLHQASRTADKLMDVECTALSFDKDANIIYADYGHQSIVRLERC